MWVNDSAMAKRWEKDTPKGKPPPEKVKKPRKKQGSFY